MAYSAVTFDIGAGEVGQTTFDLTFTGPGNGYLDQSHIYLYVNGVQRDVAGGTGPDGFDFITATQVELKNYSPVLGDEITFRRIVPKDALYVDFVDGAGLTEAMLDEQSLSNLYINHETQDGFGQGLAAEVEAAALSAVEAGEAEVAAEAAQAAAEAAQADAEAAKADAEAAQADAETAQGLAETAETNAVSAKNDAQAAQAAAELAETGAVTAETNAVSAKNDAQTAQAAAELAEDNAVTAKDDAQTAQGLAEAAQADAETAQEDAETAQGLAEAAQTAAELAETNAGVAAGFAQAWEAKAELWAEEDEDVAVEVGLYSAKHWAAKALAASFPNWTQDGTSLVPTTAGYNIGSETVEVGNIYQGDSGLHVFGNDQDALIYHNGTYFVVENDTGEMYIDLKQDSNNINFRTGSTPSTKWQIENAGHLMPGAAGTYNIGSSSVGINNIYQGDSGYHFFGDNQEAELYHTGTKFTINNTVGDLYINQNADTNAIYFQTGTTLVERWRITNGGTIQPGAADTYNIGTTSKEVSNIYTKACVIGTSQEMSLTAGSSIAYINANDDNDLLLSTQGSGQMRFYTDGVWRWRMSSSGTFYPAADATYNLGSTTIGIRHIYQGDTCIHYLGAGQDFQMYHSGATFIMQNKTGSIFIDNKNASGNIYFRTGAAPSTRWHITAIGNLEPSVTNSYNIGSTSLRVKTIYAQNALNTSDERIKEGIEDSNLGLGFINMLRPVKYRLIEFQNERTHHGLIAQEVEDVRDALGLGELDENIVHYHKDQDRYDLNYQELIGPMIQAIKDLSAEVDRLKGV
jgi:hypothetical protein